MEEGTKRLQTWDKFLFSSVLWETFANIQFTMVLTPFCVSDAKDENTKKFAVRPVAK